MFGKNICWYFQRDSCRFGSNCRNLHVYEGQERRARTPERKTITFRNPIAEQPSGVSVLRRNRYVVNNLPQDSALNHHMEKVTKDIAESDSMWAASCYSYLQTHGNLQGFEDFSPEEMRLKAYRNPREYIHDVHNLSRNVSELKKSFFNKTPAAQEILSDYMKHGASKVKQSLQPCPGFTSSMDSASNFFSKAQNPQTSGFPSYKRSKDPFKFKNHPAFREKAQTTCFDSNVFAKAIDEYHQSLNKSHLTAAQASKSSSQFRFSNPFVKSEFLKKVSGKCLMYSNVDELEPEELDQFKATSFTYGRTPLNCPPAELC